MSSRLPKLKLEWLPGRYAVCRLEPGATLPGWVSADVGVRLGGSLLSVTRTDRELSIVIEESLVPVQAPGMKVERGFAAMRIVGTLDFALTGILAKLTGGLAEAQVPVFALSTFETDLLLIQARQAREAVAALRALPGVVAPESLP